MTREDKIDRQMKDSFPASDPPSYSGGKHIIGAPVARESEAVTRRCAGSERGGKEGA